MLMPQRIKRVEANSKRAVSLPSKLIHDLRAMIDTARCDVARTVNSAQVMLYWDLGNRINQQILKEKRATYGDEIVQNLAMRLETEYGKGFSRANLFNMIRFATAYYDREKVYTLCRQLSWSHFRILFYLDDNLKREFYTQMCRVENWSVRTLRKKVDGMLFERTALSKKPEKMIEKELKRLSMHDTFTPDLVFRDPYFLDFLELSDTYSERDLEAAIIHEMEAFILELGAGFSFIARQKRITIDRRDYFIDLLFYNRYLKRLVAIDLKIGELKAEYKGQMELYLRWLEKYEMQEDENHPVGLILCAGKSDEHVELLQLSKTGIRVASYMTRLPSKKKLEQTLHRAIQKARASLETRSDSKKPQQRIK